MKTVGGRMQGPKGHSLRPEGLRVGFLRVGSEPPPHQLEGLGECCKLPWQGSGWSLNHLKGFHYFSTQDGLS